MKEEVQEWRWHVLLSVTSGGWSLFGALPPRTSSGHRIECRATFDDLREAEMLGITLLASESETSSDGQDCSYSEPHTLLFKTYVSEDALVYGWCGVSSAEAGYGSLKRAVKFLINEDVTGPRMEE